MPKKRGSRNEETVQRIEHMQFAADLLNDIAFELNSQIRELKDDEGIETSSNVITIPLPSLEDEE